MWSLFLQSPGSRWEKDFNPQLQGCLAKLTLKPLPGLVFVCCDPPVLPFCDMLFLVFKNSILEIQGGSSVRETLGAQHEHLSSDLRSPCKEQSTTVHVCSPSTGRQRA